MNNANIKQLNFGLALGGGAVKGLAHIGLLKLLDKHELKPSHVSGTSMGAIIGALYASGLSAEKIEQRLREHIIEPGEKLKNIYKKRSNLVKWTKVFGIEKSKGGLVKADGLFTYLFDELIDLQFEDLVLPFTTCATDFYRGTEVVLDQGSVLNAVRASMAVPGIFAPVELEHKGETLCLVDGGLVNNVPSNHIQHCQLKLASDVLSLPTKEQPKTVDVINGAINIMIVNSARKCLVESPVHLCHNIDTSGIEAFDFHKIDEVLNRGNKAAQDFESALLSQFRAHV